MSKEKLLKEENQSLVTENIDNDIKIQNLLLKKQNYYIIFPLLMLTLILTHAVITELLIFNNFPLLWLFQWKGVTFIFLIICYGHIFTILTLVIYIILSKTSKLGYYLIIFLLTMIGCFFHLWIILFTLHNPSKYEMNVLKISLISVYLLATFLFVKVVRILILIKNRNTE